MNHSPIIISGAGIGGLTLALTLHQIGIRCQVLESVSELRALGVGINLQPNAVRELIDLGIDTTDLDQIGIQTKEWALVGLNGKDIYSEVRGLHAGYHWPQYSLHRGELQMLLVREFMKRLGPDALSLGHRITGYSQNQEGVAVSVETKDGLKTTLQGSMLIGADGLHSAVRSQMYPSQPPIRWSGRVMWRGVTQSKPIRTGASFVGLGTDSHRLVFYPISEPNPDTGLASINWIAEIAVGNDADRSNVDWNKQVETKAFIHHFSGWNYEWLNVAALIEGAEAVFEYPMVDRDPVPSWIDGNVALLGDAAHIMYPTGSNGASQAIVDARELGASIIEHGVTATALSAYDDKLCAEVSEVVLRNRGAGPFGILSVIEERSGGRDVNIEDVITKEEIEDHMASYKQAAGFAIKSLNQAKPTISPDDRRVD